MIYKLRNKKDGQVVSVEASSPEEAVAKMSSSTPSSPTTPTQPQTQGKTLFESIAPTGGAMLGGFAGPVGTGIGYSIGDSLREITKQMKSGGEDILANLIGKAQGLKLTDYGQQRADQLGYTDAQSAKPELLKRFMETGQKVTDQPKFTYGKAALESLAEPEALNRAVGFEAKNVGGAVVAGLGDYAAQKVTSIVINKLLPKINPRLGVSGIKPSVVRQSAQEAADEVWKPIQETLESSTKAGKGVDVTDAVGTLQGKIDEITNTFGAEKLPSRALDDISGVQKVLDDVVGSSTVVDGKYILNPKAAQKLTQYFGKESFSPTTKLGKVSSDIENSAEIEAIKMVSPKIRSSLFKVLEEAGLKNPAELYKDYGSLINLKSEMLKPINKMFEASAVGSTVGAAGTMAGVPGIGIPAGFIAFMSLTPVGRQFLREMVKAPIKAAPSVGRGTTSGLLNAFMNGGQ